MATLAQIRDKADSVLVTVWTTLLSKQVSYFSKHDTYFGFNWTPSSEVIGGLDTDFGELQRPSRKHHSVDVSFPASTKLPFQIQVIRHNGPLGHGFTAWVRMKLFNGDVYYRSKSHGAYGVDNAWYKEVTENI